jgi:hypothetical protein
MTIKQSLKNRIRGWFPRESGAAKSIQQTTEPTCEKDLAPDLLRRIFLVTIVGLLVFVDFSFFSSLISRYPSTMWLQVGMIFLGLITGAAVSVRFTRKKLRLLKERGKVDRSFKLALLNGAIYFALFLFSMALLFTYLPIEVWVICWVFIASAILGNIFSFEMLCLLWERKNNLRILGGFWGNLCTVPAKHPANTEIDTFQIVS